MEKVDNVLRYKKLSGVTWDKLAETLPISGNALRLAFKRKSVDEFYLNEIIDKFKLNNNEHIVQNEIVSEPELKYLKTKSGNEYQELPNGKYLLNVPLIPYKAQATYISEFADAEYISELQNINFIVDRIGLGSYRAFEITNDSMNNGTLESIPDGCIVLGRELNRQHWTSQLRVKQYPYWVIVHKDSIICKEIINHDLNKGTITCHSLNKSPEFSDFDLDLNDVKQLYNIIKKQI